MASTSTKPQAFCPECNLVRPVFNRDTDRRTRCRECGALIPTNESALGPLFAQPAQLIEEAGVDSVAINIPLDGYARATVTVGEHTVTVPIDPNSKTPVSDALEAVARDHGIEQATSSQSAVWVARALAAVKIVAERQELLTADDVWDAFDNTDAEPTNRSAIAGILKTASGKKFHYVTPTDRSVASRGEGRHKSRITVWRSLVWKG